MVIKGQNYPKTKKGGFLSGYSRVDSPFPFFTRVKLPVAGPDLEAFGGKVWPGYLGWSNSAGKPINSRDGIGGFGTGSWSRIFLFPG